MASSGAARDERWRALIDPIGLLAAEAERLLALLPEAPRRAGVRAVLLHRADELLEPAGKEAVACYEVYADQFPQIPPFSFMPLAMFHLLFVRLATLRYPHLAMREAMGEAAHLCMDTYIHNNPVFRVTRMGLDNELEIYLRTAQQMVSNFINFGQAEAERLAARHYRIHYTEDHTGLVRFLVVPFYEALLGLFDTDGEVTLINERDTAFSVNVTWNQSAGWGVLGL